MELREPDTKFGTRTYYPNLNFLLPYYFLTLKNLGNNLKMYHENSKHKNVDLLVGLLGINLIIYLTNYVHNP